MPDPVDPNSNGEHAEIFSQYLRQTVINPDNLSSIRITRATLGQLYKVFNTDHKLQSHPSFKDIMSVLTQSHRLESADGEKDVYIVSPSSHGPPENCKAIKKGRILKRKTKKGRPNASGGSSDAACPVNPVTGAKRKAKKTAPNASGGSSNVAYPGKPVKVTVDHHVTMPRGPHRPNDIPTPGEMIGPAKPKAAAVLQYCEVCDIKMNSREQYTQHMYGRKHQIQCLIYAFQTNKNALMENKNGVSISSPCDQSDAKTKEKIIQLLLHEKEKSTFVITIKCSTDTIFESCELLYKVPIFCLTDELGVSTGKGPCRIGKGTEYQVKVTALAHDVGRYKTPLAFTFRDPQTLLDTFWIVRNLSAYCTRKDVIEFQPVSPYTSQPKVTIQELDLEMVDGLPLPRSTKAELERNVPLKLHHVPPQLRRLANHGFKTFEEIKPEDEDRRLQVVQLMKKGLNAESYHRRFEILLHVEEMQMEVDIRTYDLKKVTMQYCPNKRLLSLKVPGLAENRPSVLKGDHLYVRQWIGKDVQDTKEYRGYVHDVQLDHVHLGFNSSLMQKFLENMQFSVRFTFNRLSLRVIHRAALLAEEHSLGKMLFPTWETVGKREAIIPFDTKLRFFDKQLHNNKEQCKAVQHIVCGSSRPAPYLLFGPPGTGKTVTLVEAIKQVEHLIPSAHILACAPSNSAADLLAERLLNHMPTSKVFRLNAMCRSWSTVPQKVQECCNYDKNTQQYFYPSKEDIIARKYKVLICTLITASRIVSANFPPGYFTHVFIDEAGHAMEPEALVAIAGIMEFDLNVKDGGQVVLAGDPKQLGPVIRSPKAQSRGLGLSLLERYMETTDVYKCGGTNTSTEANPPRDNSCVLTKLVRNYRSHPAILRVPNELFYDGELEVHADQFVRESLCNWEGLVTKGMPVVFHGVISKEMREGQSPSFFNPEEAANVMLYINDLLTAQNAGVKVKQKDIGVISPYRKQVQKIQQALRKKNYRDIKVGSVEEFQGQERLVIIISTVRSSPEFLSLDKQYKLGFVKNPKRFNVAVTRAKALLIVIGNPLVLVQDEHWREFLEYCVLSKAHKGIDYDNEMERMNNISKQFANLKLQNMGDSLLLSVVKDLPEQPEWQNSI